MLNLESGDRIELFYEDAPATTIRATVGRLLSDREEGMGIEAEDYVVCWIEISVDEEALLWSGYRMTRFVSVGVFKVRGLLNRYPLD